MTDDLGYLINDADNHFTEPPDCFERYIDPSKADLAIRYVRSASGERMQLFAGKPSKFSVEQVTFSADELKKMLGETEHLKKEPVEEESKADMRGGIPGTLLNRLNPLKGLSEEERAKLVAEFRRQSEAYGNRDLRLALMDSQGIEKALMFPAAAHDIEYEFADNVDALYANIRAFNRWMLEEVGYIADGRMYLPPYIALADTELAIKELETVMADGAAIIQTKAGHAHGGRDNPFGGRSPADPIFDDFWSRANEAGLRLAVHLGGTDYQKYGADWSENPDDTFGRFDAFQWMMYWGDRPAMDLVAGLILHNFFGRFPNIKVCLSECGTVWLPYTLRKMDHAYLMGRKAKWSETGRLEKRPSEIFREHFVVAPYPEENVQRVVADAGIEPIVFGSDFPHGEGLPYPYKYVDAQLSGFSAEDQRRIMRDNLEHFLVGAPA
jgi:predicted TIM-barrel fold metal-dependent hydrolase